MQKTAKQIADTVLLKLSIDLDTLRKVMKATFKKNKNFFRGSLGLDKGTLTVSRKAKQLPFNLEEGSRPIGWGATNTQRSKATKQLNEVAPNIGLDDTTLLGASLKDKLNRLNPELITTEGDPLSSLKRMLSSAKKMDPYSIPEGMEEALKRPKTFTPEMHEATNRILNLHELAERNAINKGPNYPSLYQGLWNARNTSHVSPDILLQEHNAIQTLPTHLSPVRDYIRKIRETADPNSLGLLAMGGQNLGSDFQYGVSPRINRRLRKSITDKILNMHKDPMSFLK